MRLRDDAYLVLGGVLDKKGQELAKELNQGAKTGPAVYVHLDVTKATDWENAVIAAEREFRRLNILVNNAGILSMAGVEDTTEEEWQRSLMSTRRGCGWG